jgi:hypothetical protein
MILQDRNLSRVDGHERGLGPAMTGALLALLVAIPLPFVPHASAWDNLCEIAKDAPYMATDKLDEFFKEKMRSYQFEGKGVIRNIAVTSSRWEILVDCGNRVLVNVNASYSRESDLQKLKVGQPVRFTGICHTYNKKRSMSSKKPRIIFELKDGDVRR